MDQFTEMRSKAFGFTLIEIVMVLVLLGILSAVAVSKYFDLQNLKVTFCELVKRF